MKKQIILIAILVSLAVLLSGCYNRSSYKPSDTLITKPTTDISVFNGKF